MWLFKDTISFFRKLLKKLGYTPKPSRVKKLVYKIVEWNAKRYASRMKKNYPFTSTDSNTTSSFERLQLEGDKLHKIESMQRKIIKDMMERNFRATFKESDFDPWA